jgi:tricorn protease
MRGEMTVDEAAERAAMFDRVWRRTRDTYYTAGYHGADWLALRPEYEKHLPHIGQQHEFAELLSRDARRAERQPQRRALFSSSSPTDDATASLGIFIDWTHTGAGSASPRSCQRPAGQGGHERAPGAIIEASTARPIEPDMDYARLLNRKAGQNVLLTLREGRAARARGEADHAGEENRLQYTRWVRGTVRRWIASATAASATCTSRA